MNTGKILSIHDNPDFAIDRYTVVLNEVDRIVGNGVKLYTMIAMNESPLSPNKGVYQHTCGQRGKHLGKCIKFKDLPKDCQKALKNEMKC